MHAHRQAHASRSAGRRPVDPHPCGADGGCQSNPAGCKAQSQQRSVAEPQGAGEIAELGVVLHLKRSHPATAPMMRFGDFSGSREVLYGMERALDTQAWRLQQQRNKVQHDGRDATLLKLVEVGLGLPRRLSTMIIKCTRNTIMDARIAHVYTRRLIYTRRLLMEPRPSQRPVAPAASARRRRAEPCSGQDCSVAFATWLSRASASAAVPWRSGGGRMFCRRTGAGSLSLPGWLKPNSYGRIGLKCATQPLARSKRLNQTRLSAARARAIMRCTHTQVPIHHSVMLRTIYTTLPACCYNTRAQLPRSDCRGPGHGCRPATREAPAPRCSNSQQSCRCCGVSSSLAQVWLWL